MSSLLAAALTVQALVGSGPGSLQPAKPAWGDSLIVRYDPSAPGAHLHAGQSVAATVYLSFEDGARRCEYVELKAAEDGGVARTGKLLVPVGCSRADAYFLSPDLWGKDAIEHAERVTLPIHRPDGRPARCAFCAPGANAQDELENYPDNWSAYLNDWRIGAMMVRGGSKTREELQAEIEQVLGSIRVLTAEALHAEVEGRLALGDIARAEDALRRMSEQFSESPRLGEVATAFYRFAQGEPASSLLQDLATRVARQHPSAALPRAWLTGPKYLDSFPPDLFESVSAAWWKEDPEHPSPYSLLASKLHKMGTAPGRVRELALHACELLAAGQLRRRDDSTGLRTRDMQANLWLILAEVALAAGDSTTAIAYAALVRRHDSEFLKLARRAAMVEARAWRLQRRHAEAEQAAAIALRDGDIEAEAFLRETYVIRRGNAEGFVAHLDALRNDDGGTGAARPTAPTFTVKDIDGRTYSTPELSGKVVVLKFWFLGCAPCRAEIPQLNQLVAEFKDKPVHFLAFGLDDASSTRAFLKSEAFHYSLVPDAGAIATSFAVESYPTHVVIGKDGRVVGRLVGSSKTRDADLRRLIEQALRGP